MKLLLRLVKRRKMVTSLRFVWEFVVAKKVLFMFIGVMTLLTLFYFLFVGATIRGAFFGTLVTVLVFGTLGWLWGEVLTAIKLSIRRSVQRIIREEMNSFSRDASE